MVHISRLPFHVLRVGGLCLAMNKAMLMPPEERLPESAERKVSFFEVGDTNVSVDAHVWKPKKLSVDILPVIPEKRKGYWPATQTLRTPSQVDNGYAWVVCFAVCMLNIATDGFCFTLNILFPIFLEKYGESFAATSMIGAVLTGVMLLSGPIVGYLLSRLGARILCFAGAALAATGAVISAMAGSVFFLILSLGLLTGFGFGCMIIAAMVSIMTWFVEYRPLAMGISSIVGGSGMFIFPLLLSVLRQEYGLEGCFLMFGGIILQGCVFGLLLRPAPTPRMSRRDCEVMTTKPSGGYDIRIFKNWKYDLLLASNFIYALGYFPLMMFVVQRAEQYPSITPEEAAFLPTVIGVANIGGRVVGMALLGRHFINNVLLTSGVELLAGLTIVLSVFCKTYNAHVLFGVAYGLAGGYGMVALGIVMAELISVHQMAIASGFVTFSVGISALSGGPLAGLILDYTLNYTQVFLVMGSFVTIGAVFMLIIWMGQYRSARRIY